MTTIDYTSRDFAAIREALLERANTLVPEWNTNNASDLGVVLMELFAYVGDVLAFYQDRIAGEAYLSTATQESTVRAIARMLGYTPVGLSAAVGTVTFSVPPTTNSTVTVPARTKVQTVRTDGQPGLIYETDEDLVIEGSTLDPPVFSKSVTVTQGETIPLEMLGTSNGRALQNFSLFRTNVVESSVVIDVVESTGRTFRWTKVADLFESKPGDLHYTLATDGAGVTTVEFGDGFFGAIPPRDASLTVSYRVASGSEGNVAAGSITQLVGFVPNVSSVENPAAMFGGEDREPVESIRRNAPAARVASSRAVTTEDYANLALRVPGVAKAQAVATVWSAIDLYVAPEAGSALSAAQKTQVQDFLDPRKMVGATVALLDPTYVSVDVTLSVQVLDGFYRDYIEQLVRGTLRGWLDYSVTTFGQNVSLSSLYHALQNTVGVDYASVTQMYRHGGAPGVGNVDLDVGEIPVLGTVTLTIDGGIPAAP